MRIETFKTNQYEFADDIYSLSTLMEDSSEANEYKRVVFVSIFNTINVGMGTFFIGYKDEKKVAFGFFAHGTEDKNFRRLQYFAVLPKYRNKGIGTEVLSLALKQETNIVSGVNIPCSRSLTEFYKCLGFKFIMEVEDVETYGHNQVILSLHSKDTNIESSDYGRYAECTVAEPDVYPFYRELEVAFGIELMPK